PGWRFAFCSSSRKSCRARLRRNRSYTAASGTGSTTRNALITASTNSAGGMEAPTRPIRSRRALGLPVSAGDMGGMQLLQDIDDSAAGFTGRHADLQIYQTAAAFPVQGRILEICVHVCGELFPLPRNARSTQFHDRSQVLVIVVVVPDGHAEDRRVGAI